MELKRESKETTTYTCKKCGETVETTTANYPDTRNCGCGFRSNKALEGLTIDGVTFLSRVKKGQYYLCQKDGDDEYFMIKVRSHECSVYAAKHVYGRFVGEKVNKLTITEIVDTQNIRCKCECGSERVYPLTKFLTKNGVRDRETAPYSCGCIQRRDVTRKERIDAMIGKKYGHLTVLKDRGKGKYSQTMLECVCDCGKHVVVLEKNLKHGSPVENKSCGCVRDEMVRQTSLKRGRAYRKKYLETEVGKRYGHLTIIAVIDKCEEYRSTHVVAKCDCGTIKVYALAEIRQGKTKTCGCGCRE